MNAAAMIIRPPVLADEGAWRRLWHGYNRFYRAEVSEAATASTWARLCERSGPVFGLLAENSAASPAAILGFAICVTHPSSWSTAPSCYLEDLFVDPGARGSGVAAALIEAAADAARARGADRLYWHTQEFNAPARSLYDTLAERTSFIVYRKRLD